MKKKQNQKPKRVEELSNFPFKSFQEFRKANIEGIAEPGIDSGIALKWAQNGTYAPGILRIQIFFLMLISYIAVLSFIIWTIISKSWLMLLVSPFLLIAFFIFHPSAAKILGIIHYGFIGLSFIGLVYAFMANRPGLLVFCLALIVIWYSEKIIYRKALNYLAKAVYEHEDLLCTLWKNKLLCIIFFNDNRYWVDFKIENGQIIYYDDK